MDTYTADAGVQTRALAETSAENLAVQIRQGEAFQQFQQQIERLQQDGEALTRLQDFQQEQQSLAALQPFGAVADEQLQALRAKEQHMRAHPVVAGFFAAQQALLDQCAEVGAMINAGLGLDFANFAKPAGGCGCGGGGCS